MNTPDLKTLRAVYDLLCDATRCAAVKLNRKTPDEFLGDYFDAEPEQALLGEAKRLRGLVAQL